jgi:hypothetical protein
MTNSYAFAEDAGKLLGSLFQIALNLYEQLVEIQRLVRQSVVFHKVLSWGHSNDVGGSGAMWNMGQNETSLYFCMDLIEFVYLSTDLCLTDSAHSNSKIQSFEQSVKFRVSVGVSGSSRKPSRSQYPE